MESYFAFICVILALWYIWRKKHLSTFKKLGIPGPEPSLLFGNMLELFSKGSIECHREWIRKYGKVVGYFYGMKAVLLVADPEVLKNIFIRDFPKFVNREPFNPLSVYEKHNKDLQSVLILPGKPWKDVRSVLTPTFTAAKMKQMAGSMNSSIETMTNVLKEKAATGKEFDIYDTYQRLTLDVITRTAFGIRTDIQTNFKSKLMKMTRALFSQMYVDPFVFIGLCFPFLRWTCLKLNELFLRILNGGSNPNTWLRKNVRNVLDHRRKNPQGTKCDLLQLMIDSKIHIGAKEVDTSALEIGNAESESKISKEEDTNKSIRGMTDAEIVSSSFVVLLAGYETTSTALAFTTYLLAKNQDVQQKLYEEINALIEDGQKLEYSTVSKMPYLDKVWNESLRVYPPVMLFTNRYAMEDVQYGGLKIPKGTLIQAPVYILHHDPESWENPEVFDPERFNNKMNTKGITYMPFGVGPRNCLGLRFAQLEAKLVLSHVLYRFKITLADRHKKFKMQYKVRTIVPEEGLQVKLESRQDG